LSVAGRLAELGITVPQPSSPVASYAMAVEDHGLLYLSGHVPRRNGEVITGRVGDDVDPDTANAIARTVALDMLATIASVTDLEAVRRIVKLNGYVRSAAGFAGQSAVINGASDLFAEVFGQERGVHARAALGVAELPGGAVLEIDALVRIA
jgi:enamine deaminase RidA (YjgF/YER057c/UK114 family)